MKIIKFIISLSIFTAASIFGPAVASSQAVTIQACPIATTYVATSRTAGWIPTNTYSAWSLGPQQVSYTVGSAVTSSFTYSGSVAVSTGAVIAAAEIKFGIDYSSSTSSSQSWTHSVSIPSGTTGRILVLHRADRIKFTKYVDNANCTTTTYSGLTAYVPRNSLTNNDYCVIADYTPAKTSWSSTCVD